MKKVNLLSKIEMKNVMGGVVTPSGCIVYSITRDSYGNTVRAFLDEAGNADEAIKMATNYATSTGNRFGYDCQDAKGNYEHSYE